MESCLSARFLYRRLPVVTAAQAIALATHTNRIKMLAVHIEYLLFLCWSSGPFMISSYNKSAPDIKKPAGMYRTLVQSTSRRAATILG